MNASKLQICKRHRDRDSANPNFSPWENQGWGINPTKGNWTLRLRVQVGAGDGWEAPAPPPLFYGCVCVPSEWGGGRGGGGWL